jgi:hypothetical protein
MVPDAEHFRPFGLGTLELLKSIEVREVEHARFYIVSCVSRELERALIVPGRKTLVEGIESCPACKGRMKLVAMVTEPRNIVRFLCALGEPTDVPARSPNRGPPYWKSTVVRRKALGDAV